MTYALIFLALIMACVVGYLLSQTLFRQPWLAQDPLENRPAGAPQTLNPRTVGLGVFLAVVTSVFGLFFSAYAMRMGLSDWIRLDEPPVLWANTLILFVASIAMHRAVLTARKNDVAGTRSSLMAGGILSFAFLAGQVLAWNQLNEAGLYMRANPANAFFYLLTALHGMHLLGGIWVWGRALQRLRHAERVGDVRLSVELCTAYWHFLLLVWIFLFVLLLNT